MGSRSAIEESRTSRQTTSPTLHRTACLYTRVCSWLPRGKCFRSARPLQPCHGARIGLCLSRYYCCGNWGLTREAVDSLRTRDVGWKARIDSAACTTWRQFALALYHPAYDAFLPHYDQSGCNALMVLTRCRSNEWIVVTSNEYISSCTWSKPFVTSQLTMSMKRRANNIVIYLLERQFKRIPVEMLLTN